MRLFVVSLCLHVKDQGQTKEEPKRNQRTPHYKKCVLLRLPFLFRLLYLALFHREKTERRPRERRHNSQTTKRLFLNTTSLKKFPSFLKQLSSCISFASLRMLLADSSLFITPESHSGKSCLYVENAQKSAFFLAQFKIILYLCSRIRKTTCGL